MNVRALEQEIADTQAKLTGQPIGEPVTYTIGAHPKINAVVITREASHFHVVILDNDDKPVRPEDVDPDTTDLMASAFTSGVGILPVDGATALLRGFLSEADDVKFTAELERLMSEGKIDSYAGICEPGYGCGPKGVLLANWNNIDKELQEWLELQGYTQHWSDEWDSCSECGKIFRVTGDCYGWKKYAAEGVDGMVCGDCLKKDPAVYLRSLEGSHSHAVTLDINPADHGYIKVNNSTYESGWHPGQNADPKTIAATVRSRGVTRFVFVVASVGQFDVRFDLYVHADHAGVLPELRKALGLSDEA